eukprot:CAMPEP_0182419816 /NCGR_PEP_ID=MMETSP1167-20130531/4180_1 /TAXON_ID=2988 /ORGANISM="Mallomonas Sp, Strain CCMP3275" /LENGTH=142 /DNA_ID=CAMNT_0024594925 /DNA_START=364 /DNA_END=788 /DNA_ORIENTATION=-
MNIVRHVVPVMIESGNTQWSKKYPSESHFVQDICQNELWVAITNNDLSGVVALTTDQPVEYTEVGLDVSEIAIVPHRLAVSPTYERTGIASLFMSKAEEIARERGYSSVRVDTCSKNPRARAMLERCGYQYLGELLNGFELA